MNIYAMRHGFTRMNKEKLYNGQVDEDINEEGIEQAKAARETVKNMDFDVIAHGGILRSIYYYFNEIPEDGNLLSKYKSSKNCQMDHYEI